MPSELRLRQILAEELPRLIPAVSGAAASIGVVTNSAAGRVFYVNNAANNESDTPGGGTSWANPLATIDYAIGQCVANRGDIIMVGPGHAETITGAASIAVDVAGISIIGVGNGSLKPTITYGTNTTATTVVSAANCLIRGIKFLSNVDSLATFLTVSENDCTIENCDFVGQSAKEFLNAIGITTTYDNTVIRGCKFIQPTDPTGTDANAGTGAIYLVDSENVLIENCEFRGHFETACVHNKTTAAANLWIRNCYGTNSGCTGATATVLELVSTVTGGIADCRIRSPGSADVAIANIVGAVGAGFALLGNSFGNDGAGAGLAGVAGDAAAT